LLVICFSY